MQAQSIYWRFWSLLCLFFLFSATANARLTIEITGGAEAALPIAVVPFADTDGSRPSVDVAAVIAADLARSGRFDPLSRREMLSQPHLPEQVDLREWQLLSVNELLIGEIRRASIGGYLIQYRLLSAFSGDELLAGSINSSERGLRFAAHQIADQVYETLTGEPGAFATRIAYVSVQGRGELTRYALRVADSDGENPQTILESPDPIMSPSWAPNGRRLAYVSFEGGSSAIYVQELETGQRQLVASYEGINGSPRFSPDGRRLALTLSKDGQSEIYVLDLVSGRLARITDHFAIDTEPAWSPDGTELVFTSDRGGRPQVYRVSASGGPVQRLSFRGPYNAAPIYAPDGQLIAMITLENGRFHVVVQDLRDRTQRVISEGGLEESPSFAPNGSMILYAAQRNGRGVLAAKPLNGGASQRLSQDAGEVREPSWSPYLN